MKKQINQLILFFVLSAAGLSLNAQEEENTSFSLDQATQYAMQNSYVLFDTKQDITIAQKQVWETITTGLPQVSATANYSAFLNLPVSLLPGEFFGGDPGTYIPVKFGQDYNADFGFSVSQQIFDGSWIVGVSSAELYLNLAKQANEKTEINIRDAVAQAYYMVLISERYKEVMLESLENSTRLYEETKVYYKNGFREQQDVDQLRILQKNAENEVLRSERELTVAKTVLKYTMGYDLNQELTLTDELEVFVLPLVEEQNTIRLDLLNHIDYRLAQSNFEVSEKLYKLEKVAYLPRLSGFYSYTKTSYSNSANLFKEEWFPSSLVGLQASIPIFNSGNKQAKVRMARLELEKAENDKRFTEITLQKDYLTASAQMETAKEQFLNTQENRDLAKSILDKTQIKFNNGMVSSAELSQQETQYISTWQQLVSSTMSLLQADINLKKAAGAL
ncbi:TolC family protein [Draconibacterium sp. IB214405]|uniref:TolC family protein n=1 Tax=Draconibacterium sp. IB214405 TaxID=3097352 RepID=UPI002A15E7E4|nr:TolC family protein [Draconibacterium sp. IB214405]MDX8338026.1 TolC family protein [Draconibacterium sp. IB214405]